MSDLMQEYIERGKALEPYKDGDKVKVIIKAQKGK